jgi:DNA-binding LacI/PurR family transcriptional regulator
VDQVEGPFGAQNPSNPSERRRPTFKDVADEAGVSIALASMIVAGKSGPRATTAARVLQIANRIGYRPNRTASQLARRRRT